MADWNRGHGSVDDMLDAENKRMAENLATKVSRLKSDSNFLSATGLLSGSVKRFSTMVRSGRDNRRILCYVSVGLVLVFFVLYYLVSRIQR
uniref:Bet1 golgi vesicular membrane trafficking protein like n=1 Tax=Amphiprion percula TaxID=161767 RepID=A0A3P8TT94_AMPPE